MKKDTIGKEIDVHRDSDLRILNSLKDPLPVSEDMYKNIINNLMDIIIVLDLKGNFIYTSPQIYAISGFKQEEMIGKSGFKFMHPDDIKKAADILKEVIVKKNKMYFEYRTIHKDGYYIDVSASGRLVNIEGEDRIFAVVRDISEQKKSEKKLKESEKMYKTLSNELEAILDRIPATIFRKNRKGEYTQVNQAFTETFNLNKEDIIGKTSFDFFPSDRAEIIHKNDLKVMTSGKPQLNNEVNVDVDGEKKSLIINKIPQFNTDGDVIGLIGITTDISQRIAYEQELIESEKKFRQLIEDSLEGVWVIDEEANTTLVNPSMSRILGYEVDEMIGRNLFDFILQEDIETTKNTLNRRRKGIKEEIEKKFLRKDGKKVITRLMSSPIYDNDGKYTGAIAFVSDITDRKKTENLLRESEEKFRTLFEIVPASIAVMDLKGNIVLYNQKFCDLHSVKNPELLEGKNIRDFFTENDLPILKESINKSLKGTSREINHYTMLKEDGSEFLAEAISVGIKDKNGKITGLIGVAQDITERMRAEQNLKESEEKFRMIAEHSFMGILITVDDKIEYMNNALLHIFEYTSEEIVNWTTNNIIQMIYPDDLHFLREYRKKLRKGDPDVKPYYSYRIFTKSGKLKWVDQFSTAIKYMGRPAELVTIMDITEKKEAEQELVKLNSLKSELMRRTSHELKTPLVSIKGYSDLLLNVHKDKLDDYVLASVVEIKQGCERLESLIQDILNTSELESGVVKLNKIVEDLSFFIKLSVRELRGLAKLRNHTINLTLPDKLITSFEPEQMHQVISNLINNAIKYTPPEGTIEIESEVEDKMIIISIKDSGIGLTEEEKERLFTQFGKIERYGQGLDIISDGSGLGLYISKKIVELHGGKIWVESEGRNKGSTFFFTLPIIIEPNN